ncbi:MAG: Dihydrolipoyllysine-residue acetyltransferase component of pyruvate dehydrogenase complex, partial [Pseudomonadota bacterium]
MALVEVQVPDIGDFDEVAVIELLVKPGDTVKAEQSLITVESDKASMEIPSSTAGVVKELRVKLGDKVKQGSVVLVLEADGAGSAPSAAPAAAPAAATVAVPAPVAAAPAPSAVAAPVAAAVSGPIEIRVPDIGDFKDVAVIEVLVKVGDAIKVEQSLITVESDKASMEIPSSHAGVLKELKVKLGDTVNIGDLIAMLEGAGGVTLAASTAAPVAAAAASAPVTAPAAAALASVVATASVPAHNPTVAPVGLPHASPSVRKFARELGVPLDELKGSGLNGRITASDIQNFTKAVMAGGVQTKAQAAKA